MADYKILCEEIVIWFRSKIDNPTIRKPHDIILDMEKLLQQDASTRKDEGIKGDS